MNKKEMNVCTFKPCLTRKGQNTHDETIPRYEQLYKKHEEKLLLLEQKRKEIEEEEKRMSEYIVKNTNESAMIHEIDDPFERLYNMNKIYETNKKKLEQKIMEESGITFNPKLTTTSTIGAKLNESFSSGKENKRNNLRHLNSGIKSKIAMNTYC